MYKFVSIFKTNVLSQGDKATVLETLKTLHSSILATLDLQDEDRVLRVESEHNLAATISKTMSEHNFYCEEMDSFLFGKSLQTIIRN